MEFVDAVAKQMAKCQDPSGKICDQLSEASTDWSPCSPATICYKWALMSYNPLTNGMSHQVMIDFGFTKMSRASILVASLFQISAKHQHFLRWYGPKKRWYGTKTLTKRGWWPSKSKTKTDHTISILRISLFHMFHCLSVSSCLFYPVVDLLDVLTNNMGQHEDVFLIGHLGLFETRVRILGEPSIGRSPFSIVYLPASHVWWHRIVCDLQYPFTAHIIHIPMGYPALMAHVMSIRHKTYASAAAARGLHGTVEGPGLGVEDQVRSRRPRSHPEIAWRKRWWIPWEGHEEKINGYYIGLYTAYPHTMCVCVCIYICVCVCVCGGLYASMF